MPIIQMGMQPVPVDIDPHTLNISSESLEDRLFDTSLSALFVTNALGFTGDLPEIKKQCRELDILLIEDNCESLGTVLPEGKSGSFGEASTFSFYVAHHMSTIEGGMVTTSNPELAQMLRIVRANGWDRHLTADQQKEIREEYQILDEFESKYTFYDLGYNFKPTEITGFLGNYQLPFLEESFDIRNDNYLRLEEEVRSNPDLIQLDHAHIKRLSAFAFPVICGEPELRKKYIERFRGAGIEVRPVIAGNIQHQPFYQKYVKKMYDLDSTDFVHKCGFYCGLYPELTEDELGVIAGCLRND
jgi:CDP-6-deoxy-D-xylo-4-hexulose-3-dehydrase